MAMASIPSVNSVSFFNMMCLFVCVCICNIISLYMMACTNLFLKIACGFCKMCDFVFACWLIFLGWQYDIVRTGNQFLICPSIACASKTRAIFTTMWYLILMTIIKMYFRLNGKFHVLRVQIQFIFDRPARFSIHLKLLFICYGLKHTFVAFWVKWLWIWFAHCCGCASHCCCFCCCHKSTI